MQNETITPAQDQVTEAVLALLNTQSWNEARQMVEAQPDLLLSAAADDFFDALLQENLDNEEVIRMLNDHRALLQRCRTEGIDAA